MRFSMSHPYGFTQWKTSEMTRKKESSNERISPGEGDLTAASFHSRFIELVAFIRPFQIQIKCIELRGCVRMEMKQEASGVE